MTVAVNGNGYGFATATKFPNGLSLTATNTATITGSLPDSASGYHFRCLGVAEGNAAAGYFGYLCNDGSWHIKSLLGLGSGGVTVAKQLASGSFPFSSGTSYQLSMAFKPRDVTTTISLVRGSSSPLTQSIGIGQFSPTVAGYGADSIDNNIPITASDFYIPLSGFTYASK